MFGFGKKNKKKEEKGQIDSSSQDSGKKHHSHTQKDYKKEVRKENRFHVMPKAGETSITSHSDKTKLIGSVIMISGFIVLAGLGYCAYVYLMVPSMEQSAVTEESQKQASVNQEQEEANKQQPERKEEQDNSQSSSDRVKGEKQEQDNQNQATSTENQATSTESEPQTSTSTGEQEEQEEQATPEQKGQEEQEEQEKQKGQEEQVADSDSDGLTDSEEQLLGSDSDSQDCDGDGYDDQTEVLSLYDPAISEGRLQDSSAISFYTNSDYGYRILYPEAKWTANEVGGAQSLMFKSESGEFVQVITQENKDNLDIVDWYEKQFPEADIPDDHIVETEIWKGVKKENRSIYYITGQDKQNIYTISYAAPNNVTPHYPTIFKMMVKSFEWK